MKHLFISLLILTFSLQAAAAEQKPRKRLFPRRNTEQTAPETAATPKEHQETHRHNNVAKVTPADTQTPARVEVNDITGNLTAEQADSLVAEWIELQRHDSFEEFFDRYIREDATVATTADTSLYKERLRNLASPVPLAYNDVVKNYINRYTASNSSLMSRILGLSKYYFPMIEEELVKAGLPVELRAMPIIESALNPQATSRMGAAGLWQFMPATGKSYGLEVNSLVDERRDPLKSTQAACRYLKDLYRIYNDWTLAIAAYNCGPGNVNKAIARSGVDSVKGFWQIYDYLLTETRGYLPSFIGATYAYAYHCQHGIEPQEAPMPLAVDTLQINRIMHFGQIASTIDLPIETLRLLNPQYKMDIIPATTKSYTLVLPQRAVSRYIEHEQEIFAKDSTYLKEYINPENLDKKRVAPPASTYYRVKRGDTLSSIARRYNTTVAQLQRWNNIKNPKSLREGQRIRVSR